MHKWTYYLQPRSNYVLSSILQKTLSEFLFGHVKSSSFAFYFPSTKPASDLHFVEDQCYRINGIVQMAKEKNESITTTSTTPDNVH